MTEKRYDSSSVIFHEGDAGNCFYRILDGSVGIYINYGKEDQQKLATLEPGQFFGEMGVIETWPRSSTAVAESQVRLEEIEEKTLNTFFSEQPEMILAIMKHLSGRIRDLTHAYEGVNTQLNEMRRSDADRQNKGFLKKIKRFLGINAAPKKQPQEPSVESLREPKLTFDKEKAATRIETYYRGTVIFREGEMGNCMYAVHGGAVGIYSGYGTDNEKRLTTLMPGTFFGEMGMLDGEVRSATAVADQDDTFVEIIRPDDLREMFESNPMEVDMMLKHMSYRLRRLTVDYNKALKAAGSERQS